MKMMKKESAEEFVHRILAETFRQKVDPETVRSVAVKVSEAVRVSTPAKSADTKAAA